LEVNEKTLLTLALISVLLLSAVAGTQLDQNGAGTLFVHAESSGISKIVDGNANANVTIQSPEHKTYNTNNVTLTFTIESDVPPTEYFKAHLLSLFLRHGCVIDYDTSKLFRAVTSGAYYLPDNVSATLSDQGNRYVGNATLTNLTQGPHEVTVWVRADQYMISYSGYRWAVFSTVSFSIAPQITVISPETKTYNVSDLPLDFILNETFTSKIEYSLDGQSNVTINENTTLTGLPNGYHNVTVYATDAFGSTGVSENIHFTVDVPFPTTLIIVASIASAGAIAVGLLVYFKKRKH
jgi:hypothetical protein